MDNFRREGARSPIRKLLQAASLWAVLACVPAHGAQPARIEGPSFSSPAPVALDSYATSRDVSAAAWSWIGAEGEVSIEHAARGAIDFRAPARSVYSIGRGQVLWLRLRVQRPLAAANEWMLEIPMPVLDAVTVYQKGADGQWKGRTAGDTIPVQSWPEPGRYPFFRLDLPDDSPRDIYLTLRHTTPFSLPLRLVTAGDHDNRMQMEYLGLGIAFGAMALSIFTTARRAYALRDWAYAWFSGYSLIAMLAVAALTGAAGHVLWSGAGAWVDAAPGCLAVLAGAVVLVIVRGLTAVVTRTRWLGQAFRATAATGFALAIAYLFLDRALGVSLLGVFMLAVAALSLSAATLAWRRGDAVGPWLMMGAVPLIVAVLAAITRALGWMDASWFSEYALVGALALNMPMLLGALNSRSRERRGAHLRQVAVSSQDALTGLLNGKAFHAHLARAQRRHQRTGENAAIAIIELSNHEWIKASQGTEAAEEALLRSVIKLRQLVRDVDTTGRIGAARFGLILEGVASRAVVGQLASRLIASGLMKQPDDDNEVDLQFHIVAVLLGEYTGNDTDLVPRLAGLLGRMSARTRRPFRFMEAQDVALGDSSGGMGVETDTALGDPA